MSDFSLFSLFTAGLACMVPFASAYTQAVGSEPKGNPISQPGLNSLVPAGEGFTITWNPTTNGPVTLVLLKGPPTDLKLAEVIVEGTENDGEYVWTPSTSLEPTDGPKGYGIQLIVDSGEAKGQFQYTTQFGISNPDYEESSSSSSASAPTAPAYGASTLSTSTKALKTATGEPSFYSSPPAPTAMYPTGHANATAVSTGGYAKPTIVAAKNSTIPAASSSYMPATTLGTSTAAASAPTSSVPVSDGAASTMSVSIFGFILAAGAAVLAY